MTLLKSVEALGAIDERSSDFVYQVMRRLEVLFSERVLRLYRSFDRTAIRLHCDTPWGHCLEISLSELPGMWMVSLDHPLSKVDVRDVQHQALDEFGNFYFNRRKCLTDSYWSLDFRLAGDRMFAHPFRFDEFVSPSHLDNLMKLSEQRDLSFLNLDTALDRAFGEERRKINENSKAALSKESFEVQLMRHQRVIMAYGTFRQLDDGYNPNGIEVGINQFTERLTHQFFLA